MGKVEILTDMLLGGSVIGCMQETGRAGTECDLSAVLEHGVPRKEISLDIAHFHDGEEEKFQVSSRREMRTILQDIAHRGTRVFMYYGNAGEFIITTLLGADADGIWLEPGPRTEQNEAVLACDKVTFVSTHRQVKIQFVAHEVSRALFGDGPAFYVELPESLLRIQRRECFRSEVPPAEEAHCIIPIPPDTPDAPPVLRSAPLLDISGGGVRLLCGADGPGMTPHSVFEGCLISLPDSEPLTVTLEVRNSADLVLHDSAIYQRVGCRFVGLDNHADNLLQRHITRLQRENMARLRA